MIENTTDYDNYFLSYSGASLPLRLVSPIAAEEVHNRNTYFGAKVDQNGRICLIHKRVYGDIELAHHYRYHNDGWLREADIYGVDDEGMRLQFDRAGNVIGRTELEPESN